MTVSRIGDSLIVKDVTLSTARVVTAVTLAVSSLNKHNSAQYIAGRPDLWCACAADLPSTANSSPAVPLQAMTSSLGLIAAHTAHATTPTDHSTPLPLPLLPLCPQYHSSSSSHLCQCSSSCTHTPLPSPLLSRSRWRLRASKCDTRTRELIFLLLVEENRRSDFLV